MLFTQRYRLAHVQFLGLALLCMGGGSACDDEEAPAPAHHDNTDERSSSSSLSAGSISSRTRHSSGSSSSSSATKTTTTSNSKSVASCKSHCDAKGDDCKQACDEDDEDCNQACDDDRYTCRKGCEKGSSSSGADSKDAAANDNDSDKADAASTRHSSRDAGTASGADMSVTIKFAARVGSDDFACGQQYPNIGKSKTTVTPTDLRMFVQDVKLISRSGDEVPVELDTRKPWQSSDVALLDFEDGSGDCNEGNAEMNAKITGKVPEDTYVGISFSNGVPEELNHGDPTAAADPLGTFTDLSWGWLGGYIFSKVELRQVTTEAAFGSGIAHVGSTACSGKPESGSVKCGKPNRNLVKLDEFNPKTDIIIFNVAPVFEQTDLTQMSECHSTGEFCAPMFKALGVDQTTGKALATQSVFSVM
jgi:uncharacterized repeat protein (TIGR04052 family)